jgi:predicted NBD/HSP70 family sugar kinase
LFTVGAGVGSGVLKNHDVVPTMVSPVSHLPIDPNGPLCFAGHRGCLSSYVTSAAMTSAASQALGHDVGYDELLGRAEDGDVLAARIVDEAAFALGRTVATITSLTGAERIILSGEGVRLAEIGRDALRAGLTAYSIGAVSAVEPIVRPMDFLEWARGAAVVAIQQVFSEISS